MNGNNLFPSMPLLWRAANCGAYGQRYEYGTGSIADAMFVYLDGMPTQESIAAVDNDYRLRPLVCMNDAWKEHIEKNYPQAKAFERYMMKPSCRFRNEKCMRVPDGFEAALFEETAFETRPFGHGENYASYAEFRKKCSGAVVRYEGKIVASASSFLSFEGEVELDVSTEEAYRGMGLASACVQMMLNDCENRGIIVHWDAQNEISWHMAEKFGFELETCYKVYWLPPR